MRSSISAACSVSTARRRADHGVHAALLAVLATAFAVAAMSVPGVFAQTQVVASEDAQGAARSAAQALDRARGQAQAGRSDAALATIDEALKTAPRDAQLRFERGVLLAQLGRGDDAIEVFTALTQEFPELPEPHNNLATLYAARGELDLARAALEDALRALPSYALARENLGDVQLRLAERSYQQAIDVDAGNRAAREKLALTRELIAKVSPTPGPTPGPTPAPPPARTGAGAAPPASDAR